LTRIVKIHDLRLARPSKPSIPRMTAIQVSGTTSSASEAVRTNVAATRSIDA